MTFFLYISIYLSCLIWSYTYSCKSAISVHRQIIMHRPNAQHLADYCAYGAYVWIVVYVWANPSSGVYVAGLLGRGAVVGFGVQQARGHGVYGLGRGLARGSEGCYVGVYFG